jgi:hypothetical protein
LKKNSSKLTDEKLGENTPKIMKKKNDPYNLETRFTHKDQLYYETQTSTRCGNNHNILPLCGGLERSLTFSPLLSYTIKHTHTSQKASQLALGVLFLGKLMTKLPLWPKTMKTAMMW